MKYVREKLIPHLKEGAEKSGRDLKKDNFDIAVGLPALVSDSSERYEMIKPLVAVFAVAVGSSPSYQTILGDLGYSENVELISKKMNEGDIERAAKHTPDEMAKEVALCGTAEEVRQRMEEYRSAGVNLPLLNPTPPYAYYPLFPTHLPDKLGAGRLDYAGLREQVSSVMNAVSG
ncbi:MAG: LLM class flavin-dependent oxidoreductase [Nitrososphaerales archaeon]